MASWIGASSSQRFWQYIVPAARRSIENGDWDQCIADYDKQIQFARIELAKHEDSSVDHKRWARRIASYETYRADLVRQHEQDLAVLAEADRRRSMKRIKTA